MTIKNKYVEIPLDKSRKIRYTINAMRELENTFDGGITAVFNQERIGYDQVIKLLFFGLKHGDKNFTKVCANFEALGDLVQEHWVDADKGSLVDIMKVVFDGLKASGIIPEDAEAEIGEANEETTDPLAQSSEAS